MAPEPENEKRRSKRSDWINPRHVTKLTPAVSEKICAELRLAVSIAHAAANACVDPSSVKHWIKRGKETDEEPYSSFAVAVDQARSAAVCAFHRKALDGGKGSSAAMWLLERRYPDDYKPVNRLEHSGPDGGPIAHTDITKVSDEDLAKIIKGE